MEGERETQKRNRLSCLRPVTGAGPVSWSGPFQAKPRPGLAESGGWSGGRRRDRRRALRVLAWFACYAPEDEGDLWGGGQHTVQGAPWELRPLTDPPNLL